jgi:hypothetical protein
MAEQRTFDSFACSFGCSDVRVVALAVVSLSRHPPRVVDNVFAKRLSRESIRATSLTL